MKAHQHGCRARTTASTPSQRVGFLPLALLTALLVAAALLAPEARSAGGPALEAAKARIVAHWTAQRRADAVPRDLRIDSRGLGYLRRADGSLVPYGHQVAASAGSVPAKGKPGTGDTTPPAIANMDPASGAVIGSAYGFRATVTDPSGLKSVTFVIQYPDGVTTQSFTAGQVSGDTWGVDLQGFGAGNWAWRVVAVDSARNKATSATVPFTVSTSGGGGGTSGDTVTNAHWDAGGIVQTAAGRLYFEMPANARRKGPWTGYVCSGTVVTDGVSGRSVVLTAAHCVYDDANGAFARNVLFVPDQDGTSGAGTDLNCANDPLGCWVPSFGVVDRNWTLSTFPDNIPWDYAFYVVSDSGAHDPGLAASSDVLDAAAGNLAVSFVTPYTNDGEPGADSIDFTHALGYSYSDDPNFMYCAEDMTTEGTDNWWLPSCGLSGGASGGPWMQPVESGNGPVISVNSWGYTGTPGMAGPKLSGTSAECVFTIATTADFSAVPATDGDAGVAQTCP